MRVREEHSRKESQSMESKASCLLEKKAKSFEVYKLTKAVSVHFYLCLVIGMVSGKQAFVILPDSAQCRGQPPQGPPAETAPQPCVGPSSTPAQRSSTVGQNWGQEGHWGPVGKGRKEVTSVLHEIQKCLVKHYCQVPFTRSIPSSPGLSSKAGRAP